MEVYLLCKELMKKYTPGAQITIVVDKLLSGSCPHQSLRPKILDLLRPLLAQLCSPPYDNGNQEKPRKRLWGSLEKMVLGLARYYQKRAEDQTLARICDVDDLIDETEFFVSVCAMLQLGWNLMRNNGIVATEAPYHPRYIVAATITTGSGSEEKLEDVVTLQDFHAVLKAQLDFWTSSPSSAPDVPVYRLSLLDNAIQELLNLGDIV